MIIHKIHLFIFVLLPMIGNSQIRKEQIQELADSIINSNATIDFTNSLRFKGVEIGRGTLYGLDLKDLKVISSHNISQDTVLYTASYQFECKNCYITRQNGGYGLVGLYLSFIQIENKLYTFSLPDFLTYETFHTRYKQGKFIAKAKAIENAQPYFPEGTRDSTIPIFTFNEGDKRFYWMINRRRGFSRLNEYTVFIDAETAEYKKIEDKTIHRGFLNTIKDFFEGFY